MDSVISATIEFTLEKLLAIAAEEFNLVRGFKQDLDNLTDSLRSIKAVLKDADRHQVNDETVKLWLKKLEDVAYDADDVLDEIKYENLRRTVQIRNQMKPKVCLYFPFYTPLAFRWKMAHKINNINVKLKRINDEAVSRGFERRVAESAPSRPQVKETDAITADPVFVGRQNDESKFVEQITGEINDVFSVLPIVGMGGIGKTTLARCIFNHPRTKTHFNERIWVCVSENFDVLTILKSIRDSLKETSHGDRRQDVMDTLQKKLKDKRCLLVLDDLWNEKQGEWDDLKNALMGVSPNKGNVIIVTTRNKNVASIVNPHNWYDLEKLSEDDCWSIIKAKAFEGGDVPEHFQTIGKAIAQQCRGSPLAANMMGAVLTGKEIDDWESIQKIGPSNVEGDENSVDHTRDDIPQVRHLTILEESAPEITKEKASYLRTLVTKSNVPCKNLPDFKHLRTLVLCDTKIEDCLTSIGNLIHLRCLDVSNNYSIRTLPGSLCKLYNLQTLNIIRCKNCEKIPMLGHLPLLKYLKLEGLTKVTSIELSFYGASDSSSTSRNDGQETRVSFPSLKSLIIQEMPNLTEWAEAQMSGVQVFPCLEILEIQNCCKLTNIISRSNLTSLVRLKIFGCKNLASIPQLRGCGASLKWMQISYCDELEKLPDGLGSLESLETLRINDCKNLQLIPYPSGQIDLSSLRSLAIDYCKRLRNLPSEMLVSCTSLQSLEISNCDELRELPNDLGSLGSLETLNISNCENLESIPYRSGQKGLSSLRSLKIFHCKRLPNLPREMLESCTSLQSLEISNCDELRGLPNDLGSLGSLETLNISNCENLESIPYRSGQKGLSSLRSLKIFHCKMLSNLPSEMLESCRSLQSLEVCDCENLTSFPKLSGMVWLNSLRELRIGNFSNSDTLEVIGHIKSVQILSLYGRADWVSLPCQLQNLTSLKKLWIIKFGIEELPDWLGNLSSLEELQLHVCKKLRHLPSKEAMQRLTKLKELGILYCPMLDDQQSLLKKSELPKISHIPQTWIDREIIR
ncbi:putative disease resistance protein RDL5 [Forsythia ovata]|uniref:Disease resistance protein RDL5 n=1 Tax=Forsythia ovata TaxID=205694 RepID=A0ABD1UZD2_9LAMI